MDDLAQRIATKTFDLSRRGYDTAEVDAFLAELDEAVAAMAESLRQERLHAADLQRRLAFHGEASDDVESAYLAAAAAKQKMLDEAEARATEIIRAAEAEAERLLAAPRHELDQARKDAEKLLLEANARLESATADAEAARHEAAETRRAAETERADIVAAAERDAATIIDEARREALDVVNRSRADIDELLAAAKAEHDELVAHLDALKAAVADMLLRGAASSEALRLVVADDSPDRSVAGV